MRNRALLAVLMLGVSITLGFVLFGCGSGGGGAVSKEFTPATPLTKWEDTDWKTVLDNTCTADGYVKYDALTANTNGTKDALFRYVGRINQASPENRPE